MRPKRTSPVIKKAESRAAAMGSIDGQLDLGSGLTVTAFTDKIAAANKQLGDYNKILASADAAQSEMEATESKLADLTERMLKAVVGRFGRDSVEYKKAGGTRKSEIRRSSRKSKANAATGKAA